MPSAPALFRLYRAVTPVIQPLAWWMMARKLRAHGVAATRQRERLGHATLPRPEGPLIWFHAASVGESLSVLSLIAKLGERLPGAAFLITSGTATSAELIEKRMPPRCRHQFAVMDAPGPVARFLDHWRPDAALFVESEIWPLTIAETAKRNVPLALINARLSAKSVAGWKKRPATARFLFGHFSLLVAQTQATAEDLVAIGAPADRVAVGVNLKTTTPPPPVDDTTVAALRARIEARPVWLAASTHAGEEEGVLAAYRTLLDRHPDLLLLIAPRHPERGDAVAALIEAGGFSCARRTRGEEIGAQTQVYLADTLGETGAWYTLAPFAFLGASLVDKGGHNPHEPAQFGVPLITGPHLDNARAAYDTLRDAGGLVEVRDTPTLAAAVAGWLDHPARLAAAQDAARGLARRDADALAPVVDRLCAALALGADHA